MNCSNACLLTVVACCWLLLPASSTLADDRVTFVLEPGGAPITMIGGIRDYTGKEVTIQPDGKVPQVIPVEQIVSVETYYSPTYKQAIELFNKGDIDAAEPQFQLAFTQESRRWVQREQLAWLMRCQHRRGDLLGVANAFLQMIDSDPETRHWGMAPLLWSPTTLSAGQQVQAKSWLAGSHPASRLLGASWLLQDPTFGTPAQRGLDELARETNAVVAQLARNQSWRLRFGPELSDLAVTGWERDVELLPAYLRGGPYFLIGRGHAQRQEFRQAAAAYLWLPIVYSEHEPLAAQACLEAAEALRRSGLTQEAENMYREVLTRYNWSPQAAEARQRLSEDEKIE